MINKIKKIVSLFIVCFAITASNCFSMNSQERITLFDSTITINKDSSMLVTENITVYVTEEQIKRGLVRDFPTRYKGRMNTSYDIRFVINSVSMNNQPVLYSVESQANGKRIKIGDPDEYLSPGIYTFNISYKTTRQLGFFENHDELYWNVTGTGWRLPIDKAQVTIKLPVGISQSNITHEAYTGYQNSKEKSYTSKIINNSSVYFETTEKLKRNQGLTIVTTWPKGFVTKPSDLQNLKYFFYDNIYKITLIFLLFLLFLFYVGIYLTKCRTRSLRTIIPLFYPPDKITSGSACYLRAMGYKNKALSVEIIDMARAGYMTIEEISTYFFSKNKYVLKNSVKTYKDVASTANPNLHENLHRILFQQSNELVLHAKNQEILQEAKAHLASYFNQGFDNNYIEYYTDLLVTGLGCFLVCAIYPVIHIMEKGDLVILLSAGILAGMLYFFYHKLKAYTPAGQKIIDDLEGFKIFLEGAEKKRINTVGTPPKMTPKLYEKYLPYAIALGIESRWTKQFVPVFDRMSKDGVSYQPTWYIGHNFALFNAHSFSSDISNMSSSLNSAIASSSSAPGSSSGSGGGGSSGSGGGGGGGGGW